MERYILLKVIQKQLFFKLIFLFFLKASTQRVSKTSSYVQAAEKNSSAGEAASLYCMYIYCNKGSLVVGQNDNTKKTHRRGGKGGRVSLLIIVLGCLILWRKNRRN